MKLENKVRLVPRVQMVCKELRVLVFKVLQELLGLELRGRRGRKGRRDRLELQA